MAKKVLIISQNYYPEIGSAANRIKNIYKELNKEGYEITVLTNEPSYPNRNMYRSIEYWEEQELERDVMRFRTRIRKYTHNLTKRLLLYFEMLYKFIRSVNRLKGDYDFIIATTPAIFIGIAGIFAKRKFKASLILDVRDLWPESLLGVGAFTFKPIIATAYALEKYLYMKSDHIVVNSQGFIPYIESKVKDAKKLGFLPNSLTEEELNYSSEPSDETERVNEAVTVIYTGNIGLAQDLNILLTIAKKMMNNPKVKFQIMGYGFHSQVIRERLEKENITNVEIKSARNRSEATKAVRNADIAFVSLVKDVVFDKVLPGKIIDYMSMAKPIVGAVSGYAAHIIQEAECGLVSQDRSVQEICELIEQLVDNGELRTRLGIHGYQYAYNQFRWKHNIKVLTGILEKTYEEEDLHVCLEPLYK